MDSSEARLDRIESQRSLDVYDDHQLRRRSFPMNLINNRLPSLSSRDSLQAGRDTESVTDFFKDLRLSNLFDLPGEYVPMNPEIFCGAGAGNKECMEKYWRSNETIPPMACLKSDGGDFVLHLAAASGHLEVVKSIICKCPCLLLEPNCNHQLPIHVAAGAGHLAVVKALIAALTFVSGTLSEEEEKETLNLYVVKDIDGDTPLHLAVKDKYMEIADCLVKENKGASFLANKDGKSPLYLAVESGNESLVKAMLEGETISNLLDSKLEGRKHLVHTALKAKNIDILDVILNEDQSPVDELDEEGRTGLSVGASIGFYDGVCKLLNKSKKSVYVSNNDGSYPIHLAVENRHHEVVKEILNKCPDSIQLLNKHRQNIFHIAACCGWSRLFYLSADLRKSHLRSQKDVNGNTPLHLATMNWRPNLIILLPTRDCLYMSNNNGLTALDIALSNMQPNYIFMERLTLMYLLLFYPSRDNRNMFFKKITIPSKPLHGDKSREYVNILLLVAALVATVTFAAGFTIPGGFNSSAPNLGMATLANDPKLIFFLLFDTLAMQSSVVTIATLIWAQLGDPSFVQRALNVALPSLFLSLLCMSIAFCFGVFIAVANLTGLVVFLGVTFVIFFFVMLFILGPHVVLQIPGIPAYFGFYFSLFMILLQYDEYRDEKSSAAHTSAKISCKVQETT